MSLCDEIVSARNVGLLHCGISSKASPTLTELAMEFGLADNPANYKEIDVTTASRLLKLVLMQDLAYDCKIMPADHAAELAERFLAQFGAVGARYYTNCELHELRGPKLSWCRAIGTWAPVTNATFDTGILVIGLQSSGCLWIEDED